MTSNKPHLAIYSEPGIVREGRDIESLCAQWIRSVVIVAFADIAAATGQNWRELFNSLTTCRECLAVAETLNSERPQDVKYVYAIIDRNSRLGQKYERASGDVA